MVVGHMTAAMTDGMHGIGESGGRDHTLTYQGESGVLKRFEVDTNLDIGIRVPTGFDAAGQTQRWVVKANSERVLVASLYQDPATKREGDGLSILYVYDKLSKKWSNFTVPGTSSIVRTVGQYILGVCSFPLPIVPGAKVQPVRYSPGREERQKIHARQIAAYGETRSSGIDQIRIYYPGILFAIDTSTNTMFQIRTNQGDSEILYAADRWIYYRVLDELFRVPIVEGKYLGPPYSMVKDEAILGVHWAFVGS